MELTLAKQIEKELVKRFNKNGWNLVNLEDAVEQVIFETQMTCCLDLNNIINAWEQDTLVNFNEDMM